MLKLERKPDFGDPSTMVIFKLVPRLNRDPGYIEQWYHGDDSGKGIRVDDEKVLKYPMFVGNGQGIYLGRTGFYGIVEEDKFYDLSSYLVNGAILTCGERRGWFGGREGGMKPDPKMPLRILKILAETKERVIETAKILRLPLEELATSPK